ncbi:MAG: glycosyltransferase family 4 protein [Thermogutta sp.]
MRVVHIITRLIVGGAQENTLLTCEDLIHTYHDDVLLVTGPPLGPEGSLLERARAGGIPIKMVVSLRRAINPWHDLHAYFGIRHILREFRPEVVHTHSAKAGILGRGAAASLPIPVIVHTVHGAPFHPYQPRVAQAFVIACEKWAARRCHAFISVADAMTDLMVNAGIADRSKFTTIYSGMEIEPFLHSADHRAAMRQHLGYEDNDVVIGTIARLFHLKGHDDILAAAEAIISRHPQVRFLWVGDGILRTRFEEDIRRRGWSKLFHLAGLVPPEELPRWLAAMDIVVHTSLREGLARVLPQALLAGKPVVSYDIDGAREVVVSGETGYLIPPRDIPRLTEALDTLIQSPQLRDKFAAVGRERCMQMFDRRKMSEQIRELYMELLKVHRQRG